MILGLVKSGYVTPGLGPRRAYRFTFRDLVVMRTAQELLAARIPARRVARTLQRLRARLPAEKPLGGLRIGAAGNRIVVQDGARQWDANTGQYMLDFSAAGSAGTVRTLASPAAAAVSAAEWFERGCSAEDSDPDSAAAAYRSALERDPAFASAYLNLGRLLHEQGRLAEAEAVYHRGISRCASDALLRYNLGVLLEDRGQRRAALQAYREALGLKPDLADCHYNIALLYHASGHAKAALRHLNAYRRLQSS